MINYVQPGNICKFTAPTGGVVAGRCYVIGALPVVPISSAAEGKEFEGYTTGAFEFEKDATVPFAEGDKAYLDATGKITSTATGNTLIGAALEAKANADTSVVVRLNGITV